MFLTYLDVEEDRSNQCQRDAGEGTELNNKQHVAKQRQGCLVAVVFWAPERAAIRW